MTNNGYSPDLSFETRAHTRGFRIVAGVDEAGRGPLAGSVVAAAVILTPDVSLPKGINDSKKLIPKVREQLMTQLLESDGVFSAIGIASHEEIDRLNILRATHTAMERAVRALEAAVDYCLIDGLPVRGFPWQHEGIVKGDARSLSIAAASILAKVTRDRMMDDAHEQFPQYGFKQHKGYGTKQHLEALRKYGPCPLHRRSFGPVSQLELPFTS